MFRTLFSVGAVLIALYGCSNGDNNNNPPVTQQPEPEPDQGPGTIVEVAADAGDFSTLITALEAAGLDADLADEGQSFTVFAPTDAAFDALPEGALDDLLNDVDALTDVLLYHVLGGDPVDEATARSLAGTVVEMANGKRLAITVRNEDLFLNEAVVITADIEASNGIIHVIDAVLNPPPEPAAATGNIVETAVADGRFTTLVDAVLAAGLDDTLADAEATFTVFAPTDEAFGALGEDTIAGLLADIPTLTDILLYHVVPDAAVDSITATSLFGQSVLMANDDETRIDIRDGELFVNESQVIVRDVQATNGIIHAIDAVLLPPEDMMTGTIVDVATADGRFDTLVAALDAAGLVETLADTTREFTVFAPTDDAFDALGEELIDELLADADRLSNILLYHVVPDLAVPSEDAIALDGSMVEMANGESIMVEVRDGDLFVNDSQVIVIDVPASNGVIHAIDAVLLPEAER